MRNHVDIEYELREQMPANIREWLLLITLVLTAMTGEGLLNRIKAKNEGIQKYGRKRFGLVLDYYLDYIDRPLGPPKEQAFPLAIQNLMAIGADYYKEDPRPFLRSLLNPTG